MANSKDIKAGGATVYIGSNLSGLIAGLNKGSKLLKGFGSGISSLGSTLTKAGIGISAPILAAAKAFQMAGDQVQDMSDRTGVSAQSLSELGYAAGQSGSSLEDVERAFKALAKSDAAYLKGSPEEKFLAVADGISKIPNTMQRAAMAMKFFGKSGMALLPMLKDGSAGLEALRQEAKDFGAVISDSDAALAGQFGDSLDRLTASLKGGFLKVGASVAPMLIGLANSISYVVSISSKWIDANRGLFGTILAIGAGVTLVGAGLASLGFLAIGLGAGLSLAASAMALLVSPMGMAVVLGGGLALYLLQASGAMKKLGELGSQVFAYLTPAWEAFINAVGSNELGAAFAVVTSGIQAGWQSLVGYLSSAWEVFTLSVGALAVEGAFAFQSAWLQVLAAVQKKFIEVQTILEIGAAKLKGAGAGELAGMATAGANRIGAIDKSTKSQQAGLDGAKSIAMAGIAGAIGKEVAKGVANPGAAVAAQQFKSAIAAANAFTPGASGAGGGLLAGFDAAASSGSSSQSVGTFSSSSLGQIGAGSIDKEIADNSKRTADATEKLLQAIQQDGFGGLEIA